MMIVTFDREVVMVRYFLTFVLFVVGDASFSIAAPRPSPSPISLFGSRPVQLSVGADGIRQRKENGFICDINATIGGGHYSQWGETEQDARTLVYKECCNKSGLLICKKDKITCKEDNPKQ